MTLTKQLPQSALPDTNITLRQITDLKSDPTNARIHQSRQINLLAKSIQSFGFNVPILIDAERNVLAGHGRLLAAQKLNMVAVPTISLTHLSAEQAKAFMIADNRLTEIATWDDQLLGEQLQTLSHLNLDFDLEATGFTVGEIDLRIEGLERVDDESAEDESPVITEGPAVSQVGDVWLMGEHRLLCGSALTASTYEILMTSQSASMIITDPPYNVKVQGHVGGKGKIKHREFGMASGEMSSEGFTQFLQTVFELLTSHSKTGSVHTIFMDWRHLPEILAAGGATYSTLLNMCVWVKHQAGMGSLYRSQHELALIYKNGSVSHQNNVQLGRFGRHRSNVWEYGGIQAMRHSEEGDLLAKHPTVKPIQMIADAILDCSKRNAIILDPFMGSGTTLLACVRTGRRCYGMELDPQYVDTTVQRWQIMTGSDAIHAVTGNTFTEQKQLRESAEAATSVNSVDKMTEMNHV